MAAHSVRTAWLKLFKSRLALNDKLLGIPTICPLIIKILPLPHLLSILKIVVAVPRHQPLYHCPCLRPYQLRRFQIIILKLRTTGLMHPLNHRIPLLVPPNMRIRHHEIHHLSRLLSIHMLAQALTYVFAVHNRAINPTFVLNNQRPLPII